MPFSRARPAVSERPVVLPYVFLPAGDARRFPSPRPPRVV